METATLATLATLATFADNRIEATFLRLSCPPCCERVPVYQSPSSCFKVHPVPSPKIARIRRNFPATAFSGSGLGLTKGGARMGLSSGFDDPFWKFRAGVFDARRIFQRGANRDLAKPHPMRPSAIASL